MRPTPVLAVVTAALATAAASHAATIRLEGDSGTLALRAGDLSDINLGKPGTGRLANRPLADIHDALNASGIETDGVVTFVLAQFDVDRDGVGDQIGFMTLVDREFRGGRFDSFTDRLAMDTSYESDGSFLMNDRGEHFKLMDTPDGGLATGVFRWDESEKGDALGWIGLEMGDTGRVDLYGSDSSPLDIQFVGWTGDGWSVASHGSLGDDVYGFSLAVVPVPPAVLLGALGLAGVVQLRRRFARG